MINLTLAQCKEYAGSYNVIPVFDTILADTETPVSVWLKLYKDTKYSFLLESVSGGDTVARYSFIGGDPFLVFRAKGEEWSVTGDEKSAGKSDPLGKLRELTMQYKVAPVPGLPRFAGGAVGYLGYDAIRLWEKIPDKNPDDNPVDDIFFAFYNKIVAFDNREHRLLLINNILTKNVGSLETAYRETEYTIGRMQEMMGVRLATSRVVVNPTTQLSSTMTRAQYETAVEKGKEYIKAGDIFQVVLSQRFSMGIESDPFHLYRMLRTVNPSPYMFYLSCADVKVVGASPEMMIRVEKGVAEVRPIAGTRPRGATDEQDRQNETELLADPKEIAEHVMLVDLGRNDIGRIAQSGTVKVDEMMHIERYSHVMHIVTNVSGTLQPGLDFIDALKASFPAGTLSGAPKIRAMEIIDELEPTRRGIYGGAMGYIDFSGNFDSCIVIRTMVCRNGTAFVQAGAGIVADSVPGVEYDETVHKASALFSALKKSV